MRDYWMRVTKMLLWMGWIWFVLAVVAMVVNDPQMVISFFVASIGVWIATGVSYLLARKIPQ